MKTVARLFYLLIACLTLLTACGKTKNAVESDDKTDKTGKILTVWVFDMRAKAMDICVSSFEKTHPGVKVEIINLDRQDMYIKLNAGLVLGTGLPDIVTIESDRMPGYIENFNTGFWDMTPAAKDFMKDFDSDKLFLSSKNGKLYSLPWDITPAVLLYRKDYFEKSGINIADIETWNDLIEAGKKVQKLNPEIKLMNVSIPIEGDRFFRILMNQLDTFYFNEKGEVSINNEKAVKALSIIQKINNEGLLVQSKTMDEIISSIKEGKEAVIVCGLWWGGLLKEKAPELAGKWAISLLPAFEKGGTKGALLSGVTLAVTSQCKNPELAWQFIKSSLASIENQEMMYKKYKLFPSYIPSYNNKVSLSGDNYFANENDIFPLLADIVKNKKSPNYTTDYIKAQEYSIESMDEVVNKKVDPAASLEKTAENIAYVTARAIAK